MNLNTFVNDLASYIDSDKVETNVFQAIHQTLSSFKDQSILECAICYRAHIITECKDTCKDTPLKPLKSNNIRCVGCNSVISDAISFTEAKTGPAGASIGDLGSKIVELFDSRSGKALDDEVFPALVALLQRDPDGSIKIKHDNLCTRLEDKNYDLIVKSLIAFISTIRCDNSSCDHQSKLQCSC
eukprot:215300_1